MKFCTYIVVVILFVFNTSNSFSQNFKGTVCDTTNEPLFGSTIFIKETNQGLVCNENGEFQTTLPVGKYTVEYRCLGYKSIHETINIDINRTTIKNIILKTNAFELNEVTISNKEDPAYEIMRKAIQKAPFYLKRVSNYKAESYIKAIFELEKVSSLVNRFSSIEGTDLKLSDLKGKLFMQESYNYIEFTAPKNYIQTVKAFSSSIPDEFDADNAINILDGSLYAEEFQGMISPLNPKAFSYYKFRYEGFTEDGDYTLNKIKVIPKYDNPMLLNGYIYIADDSWDIRNAELEATIWGMKNAFNITYANISEDVFLPSAYTNRMSMSIFGTEGYFNYFASVKYNEIKLNEEKSIIEQLQIKEKKKREFELKPDTTTYKIKTDSLATKRDSLYWLNVRNTPLSDKEIQSYEIKDSIQNRIDSIRKEYTDRKFRWSSLITGGKVGGDSAKIEFKYGGLIKVLGDYNYVDGFWLGQKFEISKRLNDNNKITFSPKAYYATARKKLIFQGDINFEYAPLRRGNLSLSGGSVSEDFNPLGIIRFDNAFSSIFSANNEKMLYNKRFFSINNQIDISNGLKLDVGLSTARRSGLNNNTDFYFKIKDRSFGEILQFVSDKDIKPNLYFSDISYLTEYSINLSYSPYAYYSIRNGKKYYREITSPTFDIGYSEGFSLWNKNDSRYRKLHIGIKQNIRLGYFSNFSYDIQGGVYLGSKSDINYIDYKGFNTSAVFLGTKTPFSSFMLLDAYEASTNEYWIQSHINYSSQYLLLKRLPFLQKTYLTESLHLKMLHNPNKKYYTEVGYSVDFFSILNCGIFASFDKSGYDKFKFRIAYNIFNNN